MDSSLTLTRRIQLKELEILKVFQDICKRHNLRYFAIAGTCLGAVRHKGFIPWDDDVDVAMPYEDYVKLLELPQNELPEHYQVLNLHYVKSNSFTYFSKFHDTRTTFIELSRIKFKNAYFGAFIDIFPMHGLPKSKTVRKLLKAFFAVCKNLNYKRRHPYSKEQTLRGKMLWILAMPFKLLVPYYFFSRLHEKIMRHYPFGCSDSVNFPTSYRRELPYEPFKETIDLPFEDTTVAVPKGYDRYLTMTYGDYMTPPPEKDRIPAHAQGGIIDLDRPYTYYQTHPEAVIPNVHA
ncbi:MAG: LicD family protein [Synergistaceae bacterium]|nr:LicD family protein [Synergistaceae bacterium]